MPRHRRSDKPGEESVKGSKGRSFPDFETRITYKGFTIRIFGDTYTALKNLDPNAREKRLFGRLDTNTNGQNRVFVRLPKAWQFNEVLDVDKVSEFTRKLCEEVKKLMDKGEPRDGKEKIRLEKIAKDLTKRKDILSPEAD